MSKNKNFLKVIKMMVVCLIILCLTIPSIVLNKSAIAYADNQDIMVEPTKDKTRSIQKEYFMGIFIKKINIGKPMLFFAEAWDSENERSWEEKRKEINYNIATEQEQKTYSLYDRFGGNISFVKYLGEQNIATNILDKYYTHIAEKKGHEWIAFEGISTAWDLIAKPSSAYTNIFYSGRPVLKEAQSDPRVYLYTVKPALDIGSGIEVGTANYFLANAKVITEVCTFFISNTILDFSFGLIKNMLTGKEIQSLAPVINVAFLFFGLALIFFIIRFVFKFIKSGQASLKQFAINLFLSLVSLGIVIFLVYNPTAFIDTSKKIILWLDDKITDIEKQDPGLNKDIAYSDDNTNVKTAQLWSLSIFEPWVMGEFNGTTYDKLYTTYSQADDANKWQVPTDAAGAYGDIIIPRGGDKDTNGVRNWAALAYSCQSVYHIDAVDKMDVDTASGAEADWPKASMPYGIDYIYNDDFRWIDANLKVGHIAGNNGGTAKTVYTDPWDPDTYVQYRFRGVEFGWRAIYLSLLMIPLGFLGLRKTLALLLSLINFFLLLYRCALNVFFPDKQQYSIINSVKAMLLPFASYLFYLILLLIGMKIYEIACHSGNFLIEMAYLGITIYLCTLKLEVIPKITKAIKRASGKFADRVQGRYYNRKDLKFAKVYNDYVNGPTSVKKRLARDEHNEEARENAEKQKEKLDKDQERAEEAKRAADNQSQYKYTSGEDDATSKFVDDNGQIQADGKLTKHDYCDAVFSEIQKKINLAGGIPSNQKEQVIEVYKELCESLRRTSYETDIINQHRMSPENKRWDHLVLGIGPNEFAKGTNLGAMGMQRAAQAQKQREMKQEMVREEYARKDLVLDDELKEFNKDIDEKQRNGEIDEETANRYKKSKEDEVDLKKKALHAERDKKVEKEGKRGKGWEKGQEYLNLATGGKHLTGKRIPLKVKFYILVGCVGLWLLLWLIAIIVGV